MSTIEVLIGPAAVLAVLAGLSVYAASTVLRETRGPAVRVWTLATSRPMLTALFGAVIVYGGTLLALRLGVLS
ncbi:hypothetical protein [Microbacterium sp.]|uniref:hypothetical protein n=1 Tax=Microbacterium sp. TaxID=51671 RepID=UPI003A886BAE